MVAGATIVHPPLVLSAPDYAPFIKKLAVPEGFAVPATLVYDDVVATAITRADLADDVRGINASLSLIQRTRGGGWPTEAVTEEFNYVDLVWHELEFRERSSFTYVVRDAGGRYLGCCYLYPLGERTTLTETLAACDVDVSWWVTPDAYAQGYYEKLYLALRDWLAAEFPFWEAHYSNAEIPSPGDGGSASASGLGRAHGPT
jgi:hypothetical protein